MLGTFLIVGPVLGACFALFVWATAQQPTPKPVTIRRSVRK